MKPMTRPALTLLVTLLAIGPMAAGASPEAQRWLDRMTAARDAGLIRLRHTLSLQMSPMGTTGSVTMRGATSYGGGNRLRVDGTFEIEGMQGLSSPVEMSILVVADGTTLWAETDNPLSGGKQVTRIALDRVDRLGTGGGPMAMGSNPSQMDPITQILEMAQVFDLSLEGVADGKVTLRGRMTEDARGRLAQTAPGAGTGDLGLVLVLDEPTAMPVRMEVGGATPFMVVEFSDIERVEQFDPATFRYTPPAGTAVVDLEEMLGD